MNERFGTKWRSSSQSDAQHYSRRMKIVKKGYQLMDSHQGNKRMAIMKLEKFRSHRGLRWLSDTIKKFEV